MPFAAVRVTQAKTNIMSSESSRPWLLIRYTVRIVADRIDNPNTVALIPFYIMSIRLFDVRESTYLEYRLIYSAGGASAHLFGALKDSMMKTCSDNFPLSRDEEMW